MPVGWVRSGDGPTRGDLEAIPASPEGQATIADVPNFASGRATFPFDDEVVLIPYSLGGPV